MVIVSNNHTNSGPELVHAHQNCISTAYHIMINKIFQEHNLSTQKKGTTYTIF
jgi:hypothetical protein